MKCLAIALLALAILALAALPATTQAEDPLVPVVVKPLRMLPPAQGLRVIPPAEYDRPYNGALTIYRAKDQGEMARECPSAPFPQLGCAFRHPQGTCLIVLAPDELIKAFGHAPDLVLRHERGHCNGWKGHQGARTVEEADK